MFKKVVPRRYCPIENCQNYRGTDTGSGVAFFQAPAPATNPNLREQWIKSIRSHQNYNGDNIKVRLCELHFDRQCIRRGKHRPELQKGSVPTIFPERISRIESHATDQGECLKINSPKSTEHTTLAKKTNVANVMKCKQCFQKAIELSGTSAKLVRLQNRIKSQENKLCKIQLDLTHKKSQLAPLRVEDSSHNNQNYIPQKTLKRKHDDLVPVDPFAESAQKKSKPANAGDLDQPNGQVEKTDEQSDSDAATNAESSDDDSEPPSCERQQFTQYVMSCIGELPEKSAAQAITTIKLFLQKWPGVIGGEN